MLASPQTGMRSLPLFQEIGLAKLKEITRPKKARFWQFWSVRSRMSRRTIRVAPFTRIATFSRSMLG
jgi:hypothetical protein